MPTKKTEKDGVVFCPNWKTDENKKITIGGPDCQRTRQHSKAICKDCTRV